MMNARRGLLGIAVACSMAACASVPAGARRLEGAEPGDSSLTALMADVTYLASRALDGRAAGTPGGDRAAAFLVRRYARLALRGPFPAPCSAIADCVPSHVQHFSAGSSIRTQNVAALITGTDAALRDQYVVIGAHYDHIGRSTTDALDPERGPVMHPGADDNASGTAAVLELARRLAEHPPRRSVLLVHFGAEELGLIGSHAFVEHPPVPLQTMTLMVNLDMVGRLNKQKLLVDARGTPEIRAFVDSAIRLTGVRTTRGGPSPDRSDHGSFLDRGIPTVSLFTDFHQDYHRATDIATLIDGPGMVTVVDVAERVVRAAADR